MQTFVQKFSAQVPRYTSFPSVPFWHNAPSAKSWIDHVNQGLSKDPSTSIYVHLPFCETLCSFCGCHKIITKNHDVESEYIEGLMHEWSWYNRSFSVNPRITSLHLGGGTPTFFSAKNLSSLIERLLSNVTLANNVEFSFEAHPASTTTTHLRLLRELGFNRLSLGIQDFDKTVQQRITRFQTLEQVWDVVSVARDLGYQSINFDLVYGLPGQTQKSLTQTLKHVQELTPDRIAYYSYAHVPWLKPSQRGYTEDDLPSPEEKFALFNAGTQILESAGYKSLGLDHFVLPHDSLFQALQEKRLYRNFMGYSDVVTENNIGLGLSSISESTWSYAQNEKQLTAYLEKVKEGLPIVGGHILSSDDQNLKNRIQELMCYGETEMNAEQLRLITEKIDDVFYTLDNKRIQVTPAGKPFIRHIAAAIDPYLHKEQKKQFSQGI